MKSAEGLVQWGRYQYIRGPNEYLSGCLQQQPSAQAHTINFEAARDRVRGNPTKHPVLAPAPGERLLPAYAALSGFLFSGNLL